MWRAHEFLQKFCREALLHKHLELYFTPSLLEAQTVCAVFQDNAQLYGELGDKAIARAKGQFICNCQDMVMQELETTARTSSTTTIRRSRRFTFRNKRAIYSAEFLLRHGPLRLGQSRPEARRFRPGALYDDQRSHHFLP